MRKRILIICLWTSLLAVLCGCSKKSADPVRHLAELGEQSGYSNAYSELTVTAERTFEDASIVRLQQHYQGFPVYGRTAVYIRDENGDLLAVNGNVLDVDETLSLQPSLVLGDAKFAAREYVDDLQAPVDMQLQIYIREEDNTSHLVYVLGSGTAEILVDAHSGEVLHYSSGIRYDDSGEEIVTGDLYGQARRYPEINYVKTENVNTLRDPVRKINCFTAAVDDVEFMNGMYGYAEIVQWEGEFCDNQVAVDAYCNTILAYDYFATVLNHTATDGYGEYTTNITVDAEKIDGISYENGNGASYTKREYKATAMVYSYKKEAGYPDVVGHEYTHGVDSCIVNLIYSGESGAISEALADIFGELIQDWSAGDSADWIHGNRKLKNPEANGYPSEYKGENWYTGEDQLEFVHKNSTVISHAAYKMTRAGGGTLDYEELGNLLYRTMCLIPPDCNFRKFRECVEWAALTMNNLTAEDRTCISQAFTEVKIGGSTRVLDVGGDLIVLDRNGESYDDYKMVIWKVKSSHFLPIDNFDSVDRELVDVVQVSSKMPVSMDYKMGFYYIELVDNKDTSKQVDVQLMLWEYDVPEVEVTTNFGLIPVTGQVMGTADPLPDVEVTLTCDGETYSAVTDEQGRYTLLLPKSIHSLDLHYFKAGYAEKTMEVTLTDKDLLKQKIEIKPITLTHAYAEVIHQRNEEYGTTDFYDLNGMYQIIKGVFYIDLLDFDGDGIDELVLCYGAGSSYAEHYIEVWTMIGGVPAMVHRDVAMHGSDISQYFLLNQQDGKWYVGSGWYGYEADISFYGLADGKMYKAVSFAFQMDENSGDTNCTAGGNAITWTEFQAYTSLWYDNAEYISCLYMVGNMSESPVSWRRHMEITEHTAQICEILGMN